MKNILSEIKISYRSHAIDAPTLTNPNCTYKFLLTLYDQEKIELKEEAFCVYLNKGSKVLGWHKVSSGSITGTVIDIKIILGIALKCAASMIVLSHNHPFGRLTPSFQDREITHKDAARLMEIQLLDHIIVHPTGYLSFVEERIL